MKQQDHNVVKDPLFKDKSDRDSDGGSGSGGSGSSGGGSSSSGDSSSTTTPDDSTDTDDTTDTTNPDEELTEITLSVTEAETDDMLNYYLALPNMVTVTVEPSDTDSTLNITNATTISSAQYLVLSGVDLDVASGVELRINGTLNTDGNVVNNGVISNTSMNSFVIEGTLTNASGASIDNTGKIQTAGGLTNSGSLVSSGRLLGDITVADGGIFELLENGTYGTLEGTLTVETNGYAALYDKEPTSLVIDGGEVEVIGTTLAAADVSNGYLTVSSGATVTDVSVSAPTGSYGTVTVNTGGTVETIKISGGLVLVEGGTVEAIEEEASTVTGSTVDTVTVNSGVVEKIDYDGGLTVNGGTVNEAIVAMALTVTGGNIGAVTLDGADYSNGLGVKMKNATGTLAFVNGAVTESDITDATTIISGSVLPHLKQTGGTLEISGGELTEAVLSNVDVAINGGSVGTIELTDIEEKDIAITGGTIEAMTASLEATSPDATFGNSASITIDETIAAVSIGTLTIEGYVSVDMYNGTVDKLITDHEVSLGSAGGTDEAPKTGEVTVTNGTLYVYAGTHGSIELNDSEGTVNGGTINEGIVVSGEAATLTVSGGVVNAPNGGAAIEVAVPVEVDENGYPATDYNVTLSGGIIDGGDDIAIQADAGYVSIADTATVKAKTIDGLVQTNNTGVWVDVPWLETDGGISTDIVNAQFLICSESASEYTLQKATSDLSEAVYLADSGDVIAVITEEADAVSYDSGNEITVEENESFTIDLNGNTLNLNTLLTINYAETDGAVGGSLEIIDSVGGGMFVVDQNGYFTNGGNLTFTDVNTEFYGDNYSYDTLLIDGGEHLFHRPINASQLTSEDGIKIIDEVSNITVTGGARLESGVEFIEGTFGEGNASVFTTSLEGVITLGESGEDPVTLAVTNDATYYYNSFVDMLFGTLNLVNVEGDLGECAAVLVSGSGDAASTGNACITVGAGADIKSSNEEGTLLFYDIVEISFNGGSIYNDSDDGAVIYMGYNFNNGLFSSSELKTGLYGKNFIVSGYDFDAGSDVEYDYIADGYMKSTDTVDGYYYLEVYDESSLTAQSMFMISETPSNAQVKAPNSVTEEENTATSGTTDVTATDADAVDVTASDSDADGGNTPLTTSPAAIPMAAAALAFMAAAYQIVEDEKKRKER